ncbi:MAG: hypothetical protein J7J91_07695, partial [Deltaproteobacteria bacterium]|nr:hypothetical protein [Deltaproteobacteria bacterium]
KKHRRKIALVFFLLGIVLLYFGLTNAKYCCYYSYLGKKYEYCSNNLTEVKEVCRFFSKHNPHVPTTFTTTTTITTTTTTTFTTTTTTLPDYLQAAREIASRHYVFGGYDCVNMARDLCKALHGKYDCRVCYGWYYKESWENRIKVLRRYKHAWVWLKDLDIYIEATGGYVIPQEQLKYYKAFRCSKA